MSTYLKWKCNKCNREWNAKPTCVITRGQWCPHCNAKNSGIPKIKFSELQEKAKLYGGECLSKESEYHNYKTKLKWKCQYGHIWFAQAGSIKHSTRWCPKCKISYGENMTRQIFENLLQVKFYQTKPDWIMNDEGNKLELDGYNEELKLAFEYNGCQHYIESKAFHKRNSSLEKQRIHDKIKHERCKEKGVLLLDIPYTVKYDKLIEYI